MGKFYRFVHRCAIYHNRLNILTDDCRNVFFSDFQNIENSVFIFLDFQRLMSSFLWNCFSVARLLTVCIYTLLFCCVCLEMGITLWESHGNGTRLKLGNANGKE